jgi:hypothetical protein
MAMPETDPERRRQDLMNMLVVPASSRLIRPMGASV